MRSDDFDFSEVEYVPTATGSKLNKHKKNLCKFISNLTLLDKVIRQHRILYQSLDHNIITDLSLPYTSELLERIQPITDSNIKEWFMVDLTNISDNANITTKHEISMVSCSELDTVDTADPADPAETVDTADPAETVDTADTSETVDTADTSETVDTTDPTDTSLITVSNSIISSYRELHYRGLPIQRYSTKQLHCLRKMTCSYITEAADENETTPTPIDFFNDIEPLARYELFFASVMGIVGIIAYLIGFSFQMATP